MRNKRADISTTIAWVVASLVIVFILAIYFFVGWSMGSKKAFLGEGVHVEIEDGLIRGNKGIDNHAALQDLLSFFGKIVYFENKEQRVLDTILSGLDFYFDTKSESSGSLVDKYGFYPKTDNVASVSNDEMIRAGFDAKALVENGKKRQELGGLLASKLIERCHRFRLLIPQGLIDERGMLASSDILGTDIFLNTEENLMTWTPTSTFTTYYRGEYVEIKYRQLKEC